MTDAERATKRRFDELIPWYINGMLNEDDKKWIERYLRDNPDAQHELSWHQQLRAALDMSHIQIAGDVGLDRLLERVNAEEPKPRHGLLRRALGLLQGVDPKPAFAVAAAVVLAQTIALGFMANVIQEQNDLLSGYRETRAVGQQAADGPVLQVTFKSEATERDIRLLLTQIQGRIVDGPRQLGDYRVAVPAARFKEAKSTLESSDIVEMVYLPKSSPTDE